MEDYNKEKSSTNQILDEDEEKKMDKFYAIIRGFNDARHFYQRSLPFLNHDHHHHHHHHHNHPKIMMPSSNHQKNMANYHQHHNTTTTTSWMPSFKWEDFRVVQHHDDKQVDVHDGKSDHDGKNFDGNMINKLKKRKINDDDDGHGDDVIATATQLKNQRSNECDNGLKLDLNLAL